MTIRVKPPARMTAAEFFLSPDHPQGLRQQLFDGELLTMSPASIVHATIQANVTGLLFAHLRASKLPYRVITEGSVQPRVAANTNIRVPDVVVARQANELGQMVADAPIVAIEVVSLSNAAATRNNAMLYMTIPSIREIVLLSSTRIEAELLVRGHDGDWPADAHIIAAGETLAFQSIGFECRVDDIYDGTPINS
jgi:Uma2 family endonuclease